MASRGTPLFPKATPPDFGKCNCNLLKFVSRHKSRHKRPQPRSLPRAAFTFLIYPRPAPLFFFFFVFFFFCCNLEKTLGHVFCHAFVALHFGQQKIAPAVKSQTTTPTTTPSIPLHGLSYSSSYFVPFFGRFLVAFWVLSELPQDSSSDKPAARVISSLRAGALYQYTLL